jgi:bifunctional non-homologous end joining protein LigD
LGGTDLRSRTLIERRKQLAKLLKNAPPKIRFSEELRGEKDQLLKVARKFQLEGLTAKRPDSIYESGRRSGAWRKVKLTNQQEFVIGGYTLPEGSRKYFGALLVGYYCSGGLLYAGRVGTGFSEAALETLYGGFQKITRATCPFANLPEKSKGRWGLGINPAVMNVVSGSSRFWWPRSSSPSGPATISCDSPSYHLGLRTDKPAKDVVREY